MKYIQKILRESKYVLRACLREATTGKLESMLAATRNGRMAYHSIYCCFATRLYGLAQLHKTKPGDHSPYRIAEQAYCWLGVPVALNESLRQRRAVAIIKAELCIRAHRWIDRSRARAYFAAAEDQAWFLLSLSRKAEVSAAFVESEQGLHEQIGAHR